MKSRIQAIIGSQWLIFALRLVLGACFFVASFGKLQNQLLFINTVLSYGILPESLAKTYGLILPWAELFIGCALVLGIFVTFSSFLSILLIGSFIIAGVWQLVSAVGNDCGCFGQYFQLSMPVSLVVDILMLISALVLIVNRAKSGLLSISAWLGRYSSLCGRKKHIWEIGAGLLIVAVVMVGIASIPSSNAPSSLDSDINVILGSGKLALLYFYADGCSSCEKVRPVIEELEQKCNKRLTVLRFNYSESPEAVSRFNVVTAPTIIEINGKTENGKYSTLNRLEGSMDVMVLREIIIVPCR